MLNILWTIFEIFTDLLEASIYLWFFKKISYMTRIKSKFILLSSYIILACVIGLCDKLEILPTIKIFLFIIVGSLLSIINYEIKTNKIIVGNLIWFINTVMSETIILGMLAWIYGYKSMNVFLEENIVRFQAMFMSKIIFFIVLLFAIKKLNPLKWRFNIKGIMLLIIQAFSFIITILITIENALSIDKVFNIPSFYFSILAMISLITYFLSFWMTENYFINIEKEKEYIKMNAYEERKLQYYEIKKESDENIRKIYHDLKYHIDAINKMKEKNISEIQDYIDEIYLNIKQNEDFYNTGNTVVDMILMEKKKQAEELGIEVNIRVEPYCLEKYKTIYLCSIFSNALDNAIETSKDIKIIDKKITVKIMNNGKNITILFSNFYEGERKLKLGRYLTTKLNTEMHGWGIASIIDSVEKCDGKIDIKSEENMFLLFILLGNKEYNSTIGA